MPWRCPMSWDSAAHSSGLRLAPEASTGRRALRRCTGGALVLLAAVLSSSGAYAAEAAPGAVAARVADEPIYLSELTEGAGSLALLGHEDIGDQPGTRARLLERLITARILYLDGRDRHVEQSRRYQDDLGAMSDAILAGTPPGSVAAARTRMRAGRRRAPVCHRTRRVARAGTDAAGFVGQGYDR